MRGEAGDFGGGCGGRAGDFGDCAAGDGRTGRSERGHPLCGRRGIGADRPADGGRVAADGGRESFGHRAFRPTALADMDPAGRRRHGQCLLIRRSRSVCRAGGLWSGEGGGESAGFGIGPRGEAGGHSRAYGGAGGNRDGDVAVAVQYRAGSRRKDDRARDGGAGDCAVCQGRFGGNQRRSDLSSEIRSAAV